MHAPIRTPIAHPITRPTYPIYMFTGELPHSVTDSVCVSRLDTHVSICVHPGSPTPQVAIDIAGHLVEEEGPVWLAPFEYDGPIDLAAIRANPVRVLGRRITSIPSFGPFIPKPLRLPWAPWLYN